MRTDENLEEDFRHADEWALAFSLGENVNLLEPVPGTKSARAYSHSGHERNHLFLNSGGARFDDVSALSNADLIEDSRALVIWDYDQDGWADLAVVNANAPLLKIFRNRAADLLADPAGGHFIAVRAAGANHGPEPAPHGQANRSGVGAKIYVTAGGRTVRRDTARGEGFAAQNSGTILVGLGSATTADTVRVTWPSDKSEDAENVPSRSLVTFEEGGRPRVQPYPAAATPAAAPTPTPTDSDR